MFKRTKVTEIVLSLIGHLMDEQSKKGYKKYGTTLDDVKFGDYDWDLMAMEEMADCIQYLVMENYRLKTENKVLRMMNK